MVDFRPQSVINAEAANEAQSTLSFTPLSARETSTVPTMSASEQTEIQELKRITGWSEEDIRGNLDSLRDIVKGQNLEQTLQGSPSVRNWINNPVNLNRAQDDIPSLTALEQITRAFERGQLTHERGSAGYDVARTNSPEALAQLEQINSRLEALGEGPDSGFVSFLTAASTIVGQQYESLFSKEAATRAVGGAGIGATVGAFGGPLAPATASAGAIAGTVAGIVSHFAVDAFEVEAGNFYADSLEAGYDRETSQFLAAGVGVINSALEMAGVAILAKPFSEAGKKLFKQSLREVTSDPKFINMVGKFSRQYAAGIAGEVTTEVLQENVNIAAEEIAKQFSDGEFENLTPEQYRERMFAIAEQTFKGMVILAPIGPGINTAVEIRQIRQAKQDKAQLEAMKSTMENSKVDNEVVAEALGTMLTDVGHAEVYVPADKFEAFISTVGDRDLLLNQLGVRTELEEGLVTGGDVTLSADNFARILALPGSEGLLPDVRMGMDALTETEALELEASGVRAEIADFSLELENEEILEAAVQNDPLAIAEREFGLQGMFRSADESGMPQQRYIQYLSSIAKAKDEALQKQQDKLLAQEQKKLTTEYQQEYDRVLSEVTEQISNQPVYQAFNGIQADRLNRYQVQKALEELGADLSVLPTQSGGRRIYTTGNKEAGIDIDAYAELYGYDSGVEMIQDMATNIPYQEAIIQNTNRIMEEKYNDLATGIQQIKEARNSLHESSYATVLFMELEALRERKKEKKLKPNVLKALARETISQYSVKDITPTKFMAAEKRAGRKAGIAVRQGKFDEAATHKLHQLLNHLMAVEAYKNRATVDRRVGLLKKWTKFRKHGEKLPVPYQKALTRLLSNYRLTPKLSKKSRRELLELANQAEVPYIPKRILEEQNTVHYRDMTLADFNRLYEVARDIRYKGLQEDKMRRSEETATLTEIVDTLATQIEENLPRFNKPEERGTWEKLKAYGSQAMMLGLNMDTMLLEMDGFQEQGLAYSNLKGRYDKAMSEGYREGQIGYLRRSREVSNRLNEIYNTYSLKEKKNFHKKRTITGMSKKLSHAQHISVLLNSGNNGNITAMLEAGQFTKEELQYIWDAATEKDWNFAQKVWDFIAEFQPEIMEAERRRRNYEPKLVKPQAIQTRYGKFKGGYYPIRRDSNEAVMAALKEDDLDAIANEALGNYHIRQHTENGHLEERTLNSDIPILLDPFVIHSHIDNVIYDLEVGDAVVDIWKIVRNKEFQKAFIKVGQQHRHEMLQIWARDITTEQIRRNDVLERSLRWMRTGFTVSRLAWNVTVSILQILGLLQSSVRLGHHNMLWALTTVLTSKQWGENSIYKLPQNETGFMATRNEQYNKDVTEARRQLSASWVDRNTPGHSAKIVKDSFFWMISTMQGFVDTVTWLAAKKKGMEDFNGDEATARSFADRIVAQSQASNIFGERSAIERGSFSKGVGQTELLRAFTMFLSYFIAKNNIALQRTKQTDFRNFGQTMKWARDMTMLYLVETMLAAYLYGEFTEEDDPDEIALTLLGKGAGTFVNGLPIVGGFAAELEGFRGGGIVSNVTGMVGDAGKQVGQGEIDMALIKALNNVGGTFLHYPSGQINKTLSAITKERDNEEIEMIHYLLGPNYDE